MKTSHNWLRDYVDISWTPDELADELTMAGLEVEKIEALCDLPDSVVVGHILDRQPHPDADKLSVCQVDDGTGEPLQVVCGAPNCDAGSRIAFARIGTTLGDLTLKKMKLRGQQSNGMICAADELGLGGDHSGVMILPPDSPIGARLVDVIGADTRVEWEVTPNRPDWLSHLGIAREIAAISGGTLRRPAADVSALEVAGTDINSLTSVTVEAPDLCPRYTARLIRGVTIQESPDWLKDKLHAIGLRPINNVVDITNFILMECGQPLHAFDFDRLAGGRIVVRRAAAGEPMQTLDEQKWTLTTDHLLICDAERGVAMAGVMGGLNSEINDGTTTVLLESAAFQPANIRATSRGLGLISDSSYRFERGVDVEQVEWASARAAQLICELAGGELVAGMIDVRAPGSERPPVSVRYAMIDRLLGVTVPPEQVQSIMERLDLRLLETTPEGVTVAIPPFRMDLEREVDLIEEVARLYGLNNIPARQAAATVGGVRADDAGYADQRLRDDLLALGLNECFHYTLLGEDRALAHSGYEASDLVSLLNPLSKEYAVLRPTVLPSMIATVAHNVARNSHDLRLFELGRAYLASGKREERLEIAVALSGERDAEVHGSGICDLYDLRGMLDGLCERQRVSGVTARAASHPAFRAGHCGELVVRDRVLAVYGQLAAAVTADMRLKHPVFVAIVKVDVLRAASNRALQFNGLDTFPSTARDVAFVADEGLEHEQVMLTIQQAKLPNLESVEVFDVFRDETALGAGRKSMAYRLVFRHSERTLNDKEVNKAYEKLRKSLEHRLPIELR